MTSPDASLMVSPRALAAQLRAIGRRLQVPALVALYLLPALIWMRPLIDDDLWWHLRTGEWIAQHRAVPRTDPFAGSAAPWVADSWLSDLLLHGLYRAWGLAGLAFYRMVLCFAVLVALQRLSTRSVERPASAIVLPALTFVAMAPMFGARADLLSILFYTIEMTLLFSVVERGQRGRMWILPPHIVLRANLHIEVVYGLVALVVVTGSQVLEGRMHREAVSGPLRRELGLLTIACAAATLVTPYHLDLYAKILHHGIQTTVDDVIGDLVALQFRQSADWIALGLALWAAHTAGRQPRQQTLMVLLLGVAAFVSLRSSRYAWVLIVSASAVISASWSADSTIAPAPGRRPRHRLVMALVFAGMLAVAAWQRGPVEAYWRQAVAVRFPAAAAQVIEERRLPGPLYSPPEWGGFLLWRLPHLHVLLDGRTDVQGAIRIRRADATWNGRRHWATDADLGRAGTIVAPRQSSLNALLLGDPRYHVIYNDVVATVFVAHSAPPGTSGDAASRPPNGKETR